ncbi:hypothetical protein [Pseudovibrio exalbescens]|uniref:Uncharacterized protein n=1 Tax=Pseudovibrio exalbescens TaxID=197461 RepID=A0A1U7JH72_9HYPH|nr:hypothetical protein [Pseudovibrio exalbescens]OKL44090.1 hypothetical protein A3843_10990 [Pseudovibrio exalbescens]
MIETALYIALGFFSASLLALGALPLVWGRAVRLTRRAIEASNPVSYAKANMARDYLRAQHAVERRILELKLESVGRKHAEEWAARNRAEAKVFKLQDEVTALNKRLEKRGLKDRLTRGFWASEEELGQQDKNSPEPEPETKPAPAQSSASAQASSSTTEQPARTAEVVPLPTERAAVSENHPLQRLAREISREVSELTAQKQQPIVSDTPEEAAEQAGEAFAHLKENYEKLEAERNELKAKLDETEKALKAKPQTARQRTTKAQKELKALQLKYEEAQAQIAALTEQLRSHSASETPEERFQALREELKELAAQLAATAITKDDALSDTFDSIMKDLGTIKSDAKDDATPQLAERIEAARKTGTED